MTNGFLEQESKRANKKRRKLFLIVSVVFVCSMAIIIFGMKDSMDLSEYESRKVLVYLTIITVLMSVLLIVGLIGANRVAVKGKNLILPFNENTKEAVGEIIDREILEGNILVEGVFSYGCRVILTPSYLLMCDAIGKVTAIPRDKIYWICAQVGSKGSSFTVRLVIFTEKKTFYVEGTDVEQVERMADKIYQYIPNVFSDYDPFILSYQLDKLFDKNRDEFLKFYENEKNRYGE